MHGRSFAATNPAASGSRANDSAAKSPRHDAWAQRYLGKDADSSDLLHIEGGRSSPTLGAGLQARQALKELHQASVATNRGMSLGLASSISRDLHSSRLAAPTTPTTPNSHSRSSSPGTRSISPGCFAPVISDPSSGVLSKVVGSVIEPQAVRDKWKCKQCATVFARDATIYAAPPSASAAGVSSKQGLESHDPSSFYCRACYTALFALGACGACQQPVLGSTKEDGAFVRVSSTKEMYHGRCFRCTHCSKGGGKPPMGDGTEIVIGMDGQPTCDDCFDFSMPGRAGAKARSQAGLSPGPNSADGRLSPGTSPNRYGSSPTRIDDPAVAKERNRKLAPSIAALNQRFGIQSISTSPGADARGADRLATSPARADTSMRDSFRRSPSPLRRSPSPPMQPEELEPPADSAPEQCGKCGYGPFEGPQSDAEEAVMVKLQSGQHLHRECFICGVCSLLIDASKPFVRLDDADEDGSDRSRTAAVTGYAHAACQPVRLVSRPPKPLVIPPSTTGRNLEVQHNAEDHATHQRSPRSSRGPSPVRDPAQSISSYLPRAHSPTRDAATPPLSSSFAARRGFDVKEAKAFRSSAGAAVPTRSALGPTTSTAAKEANAAAVVGIFAKRPIAPAPASAAGAPASGSSATGWKAGANEGLERMASKFGGMSQCPSCERSVTATESVPGPRSTRWHRTCLVCAGDPPASRASDRWGNRAPARCGKKLDSGAKVDAEGRVLCRDCFDAVGRAQRSAASALVR